MTELIDVKHINIKNNKFGLVILHDEEFSNPYRIAIYSSGLDYYEYYEQKSSYGIKTILFPLKNSTTYTIGVHDLHHKLLCLHYYKNEESTEVDSPEIDSPEIDSPEIYENDIIIEINKSNG
jgi:hypothetical protein